VQSAMHNVEASFTGRREQSTVGFQMLDEGNGMDDEEKAVDVVRRRMTISGRWRGLVRKLNKVKLTESKDGGEDGGGKKSEDSVRWRMKNDRAVDEVSCPFGLTCEGSGAGSGRVVEW